MSWRDAVQPALRMLLQPETRLDPHLEILRLGAEHKDIEADDIVLTLALGGALVTGTLASTDTWEHLHLRQLGDHDDTLRRVVRHAIGHLDEAAEKRRRPPRDQPPLRPPAGRDPPLRPHHPHPADLARPDLRSQRLDPRRTRRGLIRSHGTAVPDGRHRRSAAALARAECGPEVLRPVMPELVNHGLRPARLVLS
ncbi:hypothetical protein ABT282_28925 [Streptomyces sp. NPDC000927]|uniref:hypothetical protein n=1 Tax=Streptomyces sp. NPDC000927 TaxID=3154371 RepID=UPI003332BE3A